MSLKLLNVLDQLIDTTRPKATSPASAPASLYQINRYKTAMAEVLPEVWSACLMSAWEKAYA